MSGTPILAKYRAHFGQLSDRLLFFFLEVMVVQATRSNCAQLLSLLISKITISFDALLCMTFHIVRPSDWLLANTINLCRKCCRRGKASEAR